MEIAEFPKKRKLHILTNVNHIIIRIRFLQIIILSLVIFTFNESLDFGSNYRYESGHPINVGEQQIIDGSGYGQYRTQNIFVETNPFHSTGYNGGAIAMGIICATLIFSFIILELVLVYKKHFLSQ